MSIVEDFDTNELQSIQEDSADAAITDDTDTSTSDSSTGEVTTNDDGSVDLSESDYIPCSDCEGGKMRVGDNADTQTYETSPNERILDQAGEDPTDGQTYLSVDEETADSATSGEEAVALDDVQAETPDGTKDLDVSRDGSGGFDVSKAGDDGGEDSALMPGLPVPNVDADSRTLAILAAAGVGLAVVFGGDS